MNNGKIEYRVKTAITAEIFSHLQACKNNFKPPLTQKVDINEYAEKISDKAITFEAWENKTLIGLIAAYFNDSESKEGFITNVSIVKSHGNKGIASQLMLNCINYAKQFNCKAILLEVSPDNQIAINLYQKFHFNKFEDRPDAIIMKLSLSI